MTAATCETCGNAVTFGPTEHGYRGFIHEATGTTVCPPNIGRLTAEDVDEIAELARAIGITDHSINATDDALAVLDRALRHTRGWRIDRRDLRTEEITALRVRVLTAYNEGRHPGQVLAD